MAIRKIVKIDESKCNGCGQCVSGCAEGALAVVDGKARLVKESYCDGLGACLGECPQGAITIEEREVEAFDAAAAEAHVAARDRPAPETRPAAHPAAAHSACPGARMMQFASRPQPAAAGATPAPDAASPAPSDLAHWPVQLALVPVEAPFYQDAELVLSADCAAYALGDFHARLLRGRALAIACPKLDDLSPYVEKLAEILRRNSIRGLVIVHMEVPCCGGLVRLAHDAVRASGLAEQAAGLSGRALPVRDVTVGLRGEILRDRLTILGGGSS